MAKADELKTLIERYEKENPEKVKLSEAISDAYFQGAKNGYALCKEEFIRIIQGIGIPRPNEITNTNKGKRERVKISSYMQGYRRARNELIKCKNTIFAKLNHEEDNTGKDS